MTRKKTKKSGKKDYYKEILDRVYAHKKLSFTLLGVVIILGAFQAVTIIGNGLKALDEINIRYFYHITMTDQQLYNESIKISKEIYAFLYNRDINKPQIDYDNWNNSADAYLKYSIQTMYMYKYNYVDRLTKLRSEYIKRNILNQEFNNFYANPINPLGIEMVNSDLLQMASQLKSNS
jgi:hypothetical protein